MVHTNVMNTPISKFGHNVCLAKKVIEYVFWDFGNTKNRCVIVKCHFERPEFTKRYGVAREVSCK